MKPLKAKINGNDDVHYLIAFVESVFTDRESETYGILARRDGRLTYAKTIEITLMPETMKDIEAVQ